MYCGNGEGVVQCGGHKGDFCMLNINNSWHAPSMLPVLPSFLVCIIHTWLQQPEPLCAASFLSVTSLFSRFIGETAGSVLMSLLRDWRARSSLLLIKLARMWEANRLFTTGRWNFCPIFNYFHNERLCYLHVCTNKFRIKLHSFKKLCLNIMPIKATLSQ
jgi:hypothetical protein